MRRHCRLISLSLSLSCPCSAPRLAADFPRLERRPWGWVGDGPKPAFAARRGARHDQPSRPGTSARPTREAVLRPGRTSGSCATPSRAPTRIGCSAERRGLNPRPRRSPSAVGRSCFSSGGRVKCGPASGAGLDRLIRTRVCGCLSMPVRSGIQACVLVGAASTATPLRRAVQQDRRRDRRFLVGEVVSVLNETIRKAVSLCDSFLEVRSSRSWRCLR
jgi:hypothetical protein